MKRFCDTETWNEDWFLELENEYKLLWFYILDTCDHAGFWRPNKKKFEFLIGKEIDLEKGFKKFNTEKERVLKVNDKWFIIGFIPFQYGRILNLNNKVHKSIYNLLVQNDLKLTSIRPQVEVKQGVKDKEKDKDISIKSNITIKNTNISKFIKPTIEDIRLYCKERNNNIDAEYFYNHYESNGWMVGKTKMKDWKACIRKWERNEISKPKPKEEVW